MRTCLFCSGRPSTKEDAWPLWLMERFPLASTARMFSERRGDQRDWSIGKPKLTIKWLCQQCNNGWMSRLESRTKPIVESILDEKLTAIDAAAQTTLGVWAVKTAMVLQALDPEEWFYSEGEREQMRLSHFVPHYTSVWIAKCINHKDIYSAAKLDFCPF